MPGPKLLSLVPALIALAVATALPATAGAAQASPLSPRLVVLSSPQVRSLGPARQSRRVGLTPSGTGSLLRHGNRVVVEVRFAEGAASSTEALKAAGARVIAVSPEYQTVTAAVLPSQLRQVAAVPGVIGVQEVITPFTSATSTNCPQGAVVSEGDRQLEAARARNDFGVDGTGVTVGILSDSFNQWKGAPASDAGDVATGDLPGPGNPCGFERPVKVVTPFIPGAYPEPGEEPENPPEPGEESADEGRGMAQIVHDLAPGADLDFASAFNGELAFAKGIKDLYNEGARVIADDVAYFNEPFFQDGPIADAVNEVVAGGANYFSSAGNDNLIDAEGEDIGSIEIPAYKETACPAAIPAYYDSCLNLNPKAGPAQNAWDVTLEEGAPLYVDLQWAQPWGGVTTDLDMFVLNEEEKLVGRAFNTPNTEAGRQQPYEFIPYEGGIKEGAEIEEMKVVVARCDAACGAGRAGEEIEGEKPYEGTVGGDDGTPRLKLAIFNNGGGVTETKPNPAEVEGTETVVGPTIFGHTAAASAISVAAINIGTNEEPEAYSSRGPVVHLFGPVTGTAPAPPIGEQVIAKPNVTASDCGSTTFFYGFREGRFRFCGTSAAAPHAAAVAALIRSANPGATNTQVRADLEATARPVGSNALGFFGPDAIGAGLVDADSAVAALALPPAVTITTPPAAKSDQRQPSIAFTANRRASFTCSLDGASATPCTSPYVPSAPRADGSHEFKVTATDVAGRSSTATARFTIAPVPPTVPVATFARHPRKVVKTRKRSVKLSFGLKSSVPGSTFRCKIDNKGKFKPCKASFSVSFGIGRHVVAAKAVGPTGTVGKAATFQFRVVKAPKHHKRHHRGHR
jgi:hypothetical protein